MPLQPVYATCDNIPYGRTKWVDCNHKGNVLRASLIGHDRVFVSSWPCSLTLI